MSGPPDKIVRIPGRLWPQVEALAQEQLRTAPEMVRVIVEKTLIARQLKRRPQQGDVQQRSVGGDRAGS